MAMQKVETLADLRKQLKDSSERLHREMNLWHDTEEEREKEELRFQIKLNETRIKGYKQYNELRIKSVHGQELAEINSINKLHAIRLGNFDALAEAQANWLAKEEANRLDTENKVNKKLVSMGEGANLLKIAKLEENARRQEDLAVKSIDKQLELEKQKIEQSGASEEEKIRKITALEKKAAEDRAQAKIEAEEDAYKKLSETERAELEKTKKKKAKLIAREDQAKQKEKLAQSEKAIFGKGNSVSERLEGIKELKANGDSSLKSILGTVMNVVNVIGDLTKQLDNQIESIAKRRSIIDTQLQGSNNETRAGSYWRKISDDIRNAAGLSPLVKQEDIANAVQSMVEKGISYGVEQRAFLSVIKDKIARTFDAADGTLLRLIRIQQEDTTAGRLGMESALNTFLNQMYESTEYLANQISRSVRSALQEAETLMTATDATAFEYQVQKWMGSLYSVGMSDNAVSGISQALGKIVAGDISALTGEGAGNLIVMAAANAGVPLADMLTKGIDDSDTNKLLQSVVEYMQYMYNTSKDSFVVQQQFAKVFGLTASDLKAASNLSISMNDIADQSLNYAQSIAQLKNMANSMYSRTSLGEMLTTAWGNVLYTMSSGIANNPVMYGIYKIAGLLDTAAGGIDIPGILGMGTGVSSGLNVSNLMRTVAISSSILEGLGGIITSGSGGGITGSGLLRGFGIKDTTTKLERGAPSTKNSLSQSGTINTNAGTGSGEDIKNKTINDNKADTDLQVQESQDKADVTYKDIDDDIKAIDGNMVKVYEMLTQVVEGSRTFHVTVRDYGLVGWTK